MSAEVSDRPLPDPHSVGIIQPEYATLFEPPNELRLAAGETIGPVTVAYETYGQLTPERDNAIFICHALTGDAHAAGWHSPEHKKPGWWDGFVGPGKGLDTEKYFIICANVLGGCQGTTGPVSINPATGRSYGLGFPFITVGDIVEVHSALVRHLGIERLLSVVGGSLGGMQVLEWAARFPGQLESVMCLAAAANLSAQGIAFNAVGRRAIYADPEFKGGDYYSERGPRQQAASPRMVYGEEGPRYGLALARMVAHITYLSEASIEKKFGRRLQDTDELAFNLLKETEFQIESYLHYQGRRFIERFDANSYLYLTKVMDYFHLVEAYGSLDEAVGRTDARFLVTSYTSDWLFPTVQSKELVAALLETGRSVTYLELESPFGHDSFLIEIQQLENLVRPFLAQTYRTVRERSDGCSNTASKND